MTHAHRQKLISALENLKYNVKFPISACGLELPEENLLTSFRLYTNDEISIPVSKKV